MVDSARLHIGDKVKIVDAWGGRIGQNNQGRMDKWLGQVMTISEFISTNRSWMRMVEDDGENGDRGWSWSCRMIDRIVTDYEPPAEPPKISDDDILSMILN